MGFASTATLCICMLTHSYMLISVFPYSGFLVIELAGDESAVNEDNVGSLAGLLCSAFMFGRAVTSVFWGHIADTYGRMFVLYASLMLSGMFSLAFGVAPNLPAAIAIRFGLGCSNGIMSALKTIISELAQGDEKTETRTMSMVMGMWGFGFLLSPVISGALSEPLKQYPHAPHWISQGWVGVVLEKFPFLLPNLLGAIICMFTTVLLAMFVSETLEHARHARHIPADFCKSLSRCLPRRMRYQALPVLKAHQSDAFDESDIDDDKVNDSSSSSTRTKQVEEQQQQQQQQQVSNKEQQQQRRAAMADIWARRDTRTLLWIYWAFSFAGITMDEAFPLFCISHQAGFGLSETKIGQVLSLCGLVFVTSQYFVSSLIYDRVGLLGSIRVGTTFYSPMVFLLPLSVLINKGAPLGTLKWTTFFFLGIIMAWCRIFSLCFFSNISVMVNRSVPPTLRGTMNGLSQVGGSVAKGMGPAFAGVLVSVSVSMVGRAASVMIFGTIGCIGVCVAMSTYAFLREPTDYNDNLEETEDETITSVGEDDAEIELTSRPSVQLRQGTDDD